MTDVRARVARMSLVAIAVAGVFGMMVVFFSGLGSAEKRRQKGDRSQMQLRAVTAEDHGIGQMDAPVTIVAYMDLECPYCKRFHTGTMPHIQEEFGDNVVFVFRHFPLTRHPKAKTEAWAAECAYELGGHDAFWEYADAIFAVTPSNNGLDLDLLPEIAAEIGLPVEEFVSCLDSGRTAERVNMDYADGSIAGVRVTPSAAVLCGDARTMVAGNNYKQLKRAVEECLSSEVAR